MRAGRRVLEDAPDLPARGSCVDHPEDVWTVDEPTAKQTATARRICRGCPVKVECDEYATARNLPGIWAGRTAKERRGA